MKILLIGEIYSENLGDPLLCETVENLLRKQYPQVEIVPFDISGNVEFGVRYGEAPGFHSAWYGLDKLGLYAQVYTDKTLYRAYSDDTGRCISAWCSLCELLRKHRFDVAVFAGGEMFMDYFAAAIYLVVKRLSVAGIKTVFHACGMGPLERHRALLCKALNLPNVTSIALRDGYERFLTELPVRTQALETYDTALNCSQFYSAADHISVEYGIGLIDREDYFQDQVKLIRMMERSGHTWKAFTNGAQYDDRFARQVLCSAGISQQGLPERLAERPQNVEELIWTITQFPRIISFRMHSQIAAASFGIPCYGIAWDEKLRFFYSKLGFPDNVSDCVPDLLTIQRELDSCKAAILTNARNQAQISSLHLYQAIENAVNGR